MSSRSIFQSHRARLAALVLLSLLSVSIALADDESDPPGRVARLSYANGAVSLQPAGVQDWADATVNRPLTTGDKLWIDRDSRAELDIGSAAIRLGSMTGFSFLNLDDRTAQMNITAGTAIVHVRDLGEDQSFEIDTPNVAVTLQSPGDYRVQVNEAGDATVVKVSDGDAQVSAAGQSMPLHTQQAFAFNGTDQVTADATSVGAPDALDSWSLERDHRSEQAQAQTSEYVSPDVTGADDLADYGTWESTPEYGPVWTPTVVSAGWSPYQFGRWVWVAPWGWTWVDDAPWGFAPFHYGRWAYRDTRWCWVPGPRRVRPVYAPALVAWVGRPGANVSISVGGRAGVGWFPLGPREVFVPGYRVSHNYVRNVNIANTTIASSTYITNVYENRTNVTYVNRNRPGAVVAVSQDVFTSARPISGRTMRIPENELTRYNSHGVGPAIAPVRASVLGRRPDMNVRQPPAAFVNRPVVARTAPPPAPVPFERQQEAIRANGGRPLARSQMSQLQPAAAANPQLRMVGSGPLRPLQNGRQQFGTARPDQPGGSAAQPNIERHQPSIQERERALHATPIPSSPQQDAFRNERPAPQINAEPNQRPAPSASFRNDQPPTNQNQMRNDQYRMQNTEESRRQAQQVRPTPEARPIEQPRAVEQARQFQARPIEQPGQFQARPVEPPPAAQPPAAQQPRQYQARPFEQPRAVEQARQFQARPVEQPPAAQQPRQYQARPVEQPRAVQQSPQFQARPIEQPRQEFHAPEPRSMQRPIEQPRAAAPPPQPPQPRQAAPPQQQQQQRGGRANEPRINRQ
jgi:hypothetical protein